MSRAVSIPYMPRVNGSPGQGHRSERSGCSLGRKHGEGCGTLPSVPRDSPRITPELSSIFRGGPRVTKASSRFSVIAHG
eukprot:1675667-Rhodomonas_salina.1